MRCELCNAAGKKVWSAAAKIDWSFRKDYYRAELTGRLRRVQPWSSEAPALYSLTTELYTASGELLDCRRRRWASAGWKWSGATCGSTASG